MPSLQTYYFFPHYPPPPSSKTPPSPPPSHFVAPPPPSKTPPSPHFISPPPPSHFVPPPPPHAPRSPPPPPHFVPPPPPHAPTSPPPPPHFVPPPPHIVPPPPPSAPGNHTTIIVVVFVSCGGVFFLAFVMASLWCFLKKKKEVRKAQNVHIDEHRTVKETVIEGPHGTETVMLSVEDDIHIEEDIKKSETENFRKGMHLNAGDNNIAGNLIEAREPSSSSGHGHHGYNP